MKRTIVSALVIAALLLSACAVGEEATTTDKLLADWLDFVYVSDCLFGDMIWMYGQAEAFLETPTRENQLKALMALESAVRDLEARKLSDAQMTGADYDALMSQEMDVSFVQTNIYEYETVLSTMRSACTNMYYALLNECYLDFEADLLAQKIDSEQQLLEYYVLDLVYSGNYLLLLLEEEAPIDAYYAFIQSYCPTVAAATGEFITSKDELESLETEIWDRFEELINEKSQLLGYSEATLARYREALETGDMSVLAVDKIEIYGEAPLLPLPDWLDIETCDFSYFWYDESGNPVLLRARESVDKAPDGYMIQSGQVEQGEFVDYINALEAWEISPVGATHTGNRAVFAYDGNGLSFALVYEEGTAQIAFLENPACLVPWWYFEATLAQ